MLRSDFRWMPLCALLLPLFASTAAEAQFCKSNDDCKQNSFCQKFFDICEGAGTCVLTPSACKDPEDLVCGCDGETYANRCSANQSRVSVDYPGPCNPICQRSADCPFGLYCDKSSGSCADEGTCKTKPSACFTPLSPVCGCNEKTYVSECIANQLGMSVVFSGACDACGRLREPETWPTSGYYLEMSGGESEKPMFFHIWVTSAKGIAQIDHWLASNPTSENLGIPGAPIELVSATNPGYSYRMVPAEVKFGKMWIEACDGTPCFVEDNARGWNQWWCPWNARPLRVWRCDGGTGESCGEPVF